MKKIKFSIEKLDFFGQGISRVNGKAYFIPKTLPGEEGEALVQKEKKSFGLATLSQLEKTSPKRLPSPCPHFSQCSGCQYLHTDYETELACKREAHRENIEKLLNCHLSTFDITPAPNRLSYRNRIQLHKKGGKLGLVTSSGLLEVPHCLLGKPKIQEKVKALYHENSFKDGLIEVTEENIFFNQGHAAEGFTQVNPEMNHIFLQWFKGLKLDPKLTIDLFGGNGNLSQGLDSCQKALVIDYPAHKKMLKPFQTYQSLDLYRSWEKLTELPAPDLLILDPPRAGFSHLEKVVNYWKPQLVAYLSCHSATMCRDLKPLLPSYQLEVCRGFDFFPSTKHLETFVLLSRK